MSFKFVLYLSDPEIADGNVRSERFHLLFGLDPSS